MKNRKYIILGLVLLLVTVTGLSFAFWDQLTGTEDETIEIGEGTVVTVSASTEDGLEPGFRLVPDDPDVLPGENDVTSVTFLYDVTVNKDFSGDGMDLTVTLTTDLSVYEGLVNIEATATVGGVTGPSVDLLANPLVAELSTAGITTITVTVTLDEPADQDQYNLIAGKNVAFTLEFKGSV